MARYFPDRPRIFSKSITFFLRLCVQYFFSFPFPHIQADYLYTEIHQKWPRVKTCGEYIWCTDPDSNRAVLNTSQQRHCLRRIDNLCVLFKYTEIPLI